MISDEKNSFPEGKKSIIRTTIHTAITHKNIKHQYPTIRHRLELLLFLMKFPSPLLCPPGTETGDSFLTHWLRRSRDQLKPRLCCAPHIPAWQESWMPQSCHSWAGKEKVLYPLPPPLCLLRPAKSLPCPHMEAVSKWEEGQIQPSMHWLRACTFSQRHKKSVLEPLKQIGWSWFIGVI